ncbi:Uncharacterised protein [BD1-7 clade bacterium]|uniref:Lipoprotein LppC n=1 Tax=BD1-7 clade bacterium TaxID=2029982 RepID=A0A5S9PPE4_9GAMM|nr:Uncharacterised protein [BD1-7 clade bacterium]
MIPKIRLLPTTLAFIAGVLMTSTASAFTLTSTDFKDGQRVPNEQVFNIEGCNGKNVSPQISWRDLPKGTKSVAVTLFDPDAVGNGWWHWIVIDIPASYNALKKGAGDKSSPQLPHEAQVVKNDYGLYQYSGPCPPKGSGKHRYQLTVYAMKDAVPGISADIAPATAAFLLRNEAIAKKTIEVYFER